MVEDISVCLCVCVCVCVFKKHFKFLYRKEWRKLIYELLEEDGNRCLCDPACVGMKIS